MKNKISWIYLVRHGESTLNTDDGKGCHTKVSPLTEKGRQQAQKIFKILKKEKFNLFVVSEYQRTKETAEPFTRHYSGKIPVKVWPVHEFTVHSEDKYLNLTSRDRQALANRYWQGSDPDHCDGQGAESYRNLMERIDFVIKKIKKERFEKILIFTHGNFIRQVIWRILYPDVKIDEKTMESGGLFGWGMDVQNTALVKILKYNNKLYIGDIDDKHLEKI